MVLTVYKLDASPPARAAMMVVNALKIQDVEYKDVNLLAGEHLSEDYLKMNPQHTVPTIKDDDFIIWDSHAIGTYLVSKYGSDDSLYPSDLKKRAVVDQRLHFDTGVLFPALAGAVRPVLFFGEKSFKPENLEKIEKSYEFVEKFLCNTWIAGDQLTLADICCVSSISSLNEILPIDANKYPNIITWWQNCSEQEFYKKANAPGLAVFSGLIKASVG